MQFEPNWLPQYHLFKVANKPNGLKYSEWININGNLYRIKRCYMEPHAEYAYALVTAIDDNGNECGYVEFKIKTSQFIYAYNSDHDELTLIYKNQYKENKE